MKLFLATVTISLALPGLELSRTAFAQAAGGAGGGAGGGRGGAAVGGAIGTARGASTASGSIAGPTGRVAPAGVPAGQTAIQPGASVSPANAGQIATPGTATPLGTLNPGGISATPPANVGRTFDRTQIGGAPTDTIIDPAVTQPTFRFPPASTLGEPVVPGGVVGDVNSSLPTSIAGNPVSAGNAAVTVGNAPVTVGNTVGAGVGSVPVRVPAEPVAINLPPGARIVTTPSGVAEIGTPTVGVVVPTIVPTNSAGRGPTFDSSTARSSGAARQPIRPTAPPRSAPIVPNR